MRLCIYATWLTCIAKHHEVLHIISRKWVNVCGTIYNGGSSRGGGGGGVVVWTNSYKIINAHLPTYQHWERKYSCISSEKKLYCILSQHHIYMCLCAMRCRATTTAANRKLTATFIQVWPDFLACTLFALYLGQCFCCLYIF